MTRAGATMCAYGVGMGLMMAVIMALEPLRRFDPIVFPITLLPALLLAVAQWLVLRRALPHAGWWLVAGALGFMVALLGAMAGGGEGCEWLATAPRRSCAPARPVSSNASRTRGFRARNWLCDLE